jgi:hypothetical protein
MVETSAAKSIVWVLLTVYYTMLEEVWTAIAGLRSYTLLCLASYWVQDTNTAAGRFFAKGMLSHQTYDAIFAQE